MRRTRRSLLVAVLVVLAGCSGPAGPATPTATSTAAPVPTTDPATVLAPGVTVRGVEDPVALASAHAAVLGETSVTVRVEESRRYANGTLRWHRTATQRIDATGPAIRSYHVEAFEGSTRDAGLVPDFVRFPDATHVERYAVGEDAYYRYRLRSGDTWYVSGPYRADRLVDPGLVPLFWAVDTRVTGSEIRDGTTYYRLEGGEVTDRTTFGRAFVSEPFVELRDVSVDAVVDERGVVREYHLSYALVGTDGTTVHGSESVRFTGIGTTTVDRPAWYEEVRVNAAR